MNDFGYSINSSRLGLGCVTFGREIDRKTAFTMMNHAYSMGINSFDTAAAYGEGSSETIVGAWLGENASARSSINIATKILPPYDPVQVRLSVEESLNRLNTEIIDILYLHRWDKLLDTPEIWQILDSLVKEGKVKALGVSNFNSEQLANALNIQKETGLCRLEYIQNNHNLAVNDITVEIKQICRDNDIRIITFSPLGAGFLTGKHQNGVQQGSRFAVMPAHQDIYFTEHSQKRLARLLEIATRTGYSPEYLALAWATHQTGVYSVLVGGRSVSQIDLAFGAGKFYSPEIFAELENVII